MAKRVSDDVAVAVVPPFLRTAYNYDMNQASDDAGAPSFGEDRTVQSEKDNSDINVIVKRFGLTGQLPPNPRVPQFGDYTGINDFQSAMNAVRTAQEAFMELPAELRARFGNDPQAYLSFCTDPANIDEMVKLGLATVRETVIMESKSSDGPKDKESENVDSRSGVDSGKPSSGKADKGGK